MVATSEEIGEIVGEWHRSTRIGGAIFTSDRKYRVEAGRFDGKFLRRQSIRQMLLMLLDCESTLPCRTRIFSYLFHGVRPTSDELLYSKKEEGGGETEKSNDWILALSLSLFLWLNLIFTATGTTTTNLSKASPFHPCKIGENHGDPWR